MALDLAQDAWVRALEDPPRGSTGATLRAWLARRAGVATTTSKPYDVAGAILCARAAGCVVTAADGGELDFELDCTTAVEFVGWANAATARRLAPHLRAVLDESPTGGAAD